MIALIPCASAENLIFCDSIPEKLVDWNSSVTLPKFDPEVGTLKQVDLSCIMNLSQGIELENKNSMPGNFTLSILGALTAKLPSSQNISINVNHSSEGNVSGYDGVMDYKGASGINSSERIPTEAASKRVSTLDDFLAGSPGEGITLPVTVNIASLMKMPGSSRYGITLKAGAQVCLTYTYDAKSIAKGSKP
ncbi:MAG: choice-of-anchor E domain-containing protein [Methanothrix sp.]